VEVREACGGARGDKGRLMVAAHGDPWFTGEKERRREQLELGACTVKEKEVQITSLCPPGRVKQREERRGGKHGLKLWWRQRGGQRRLGVAVVHAWQDSEEGKEIRGMERTTRGRKGSRRWTTAVFTAAAGGGAAPAVELKKQRSRGQRGFRGRRRRRKSPRAHVEN
jgi:hypothetical protein